MAGTFPNRRGFWASLASVDTQTGEIVHSTVNFEGSQKDALLKSGPIRCSAVDGSSTHAITTGEDKKLKVWQIDGLKLLSERELPKRPTEIRFTRDGQTILVADKFGDIFSYPLHPGPAAPSTSTTTGASKRGALTSHENPSNGTLILGHTSLLTSFLLSADERYIISADRDEHIRVSWYPQGYNIERYCLGHEKYFQSRLAVVININGLLHRRFVSAIHVPAFAPATLVSGGGDPMVKVWDWMSGALLGEVRILDAVEPYIKVRPSKGKWGRHDGDGEDEEGVEGGAQKKGKGKGRRRRKGKGNNKDQDEEEEKAVEGVHESHDDACVKGEDVVMSEAAPGENRSQEELDRIVLVLHKIDSVDISGQGRFLMFSAIGATAIFYCALPENNSSTQPTVHALDLGKPVIDFTIETNGRIWVSLDSEWTDLQHSATNLAVETPSVKILFWTNGTLAEIPNVENPVLLTSLNSKCIIPATSADLKVLDIYSALSSMPKNVDSEHDALVRDTLSDIAAESEEGKELTQRELARLRKKKALLAKIQEQAREETAEKGRDNDADERESKKARSESENGEGSTTQACGPVDTAMEPS
ncbi:tRNA (guanine-N(7)-)-methyltransferase non-catalytic subunit TRM82 [Grifola frondosa]|uniref:tRNA (Guanine-N(7)-)-methyltransferase non-catalytic subunit TRM82 n=1 Tax=Grifola frondosa TaxID=5627 RepID=A0A1C7LQ65_GRIFR|nr:tRNA (guanine-N(7)-)-methyltransferase non-catalytic subunit TRM82 [Grifola frondosa]